MKMSSSCLNHVLRNSGVAKNIYLMILLNDLTKHDLVEITIFSTELFETDSIRGLPLFRKNRLNSLEKSS